MSRHPLPSTSAPGEAGLPMPVAKIREALSSAPQVGRLNRVCLVSDRATLAIPQVKGDASSQC